mmetsp:Transcript_138690/g.276569  ORF Transcript_138690/g.276569 Transcript_138690/m.276569 type:complete len:105 (-) Transcript_138690:1607-1921(-)
MKCNKICALPQTWPMFSTSCTTECWYVSGGHVACPRSPSRSSSNCSSTFNNSTLSLETNGIELMNAGGDKAWKSSSNSRGMQRDHVPTVKIRMPHLQKMPSKFG